MLHFFFDRVDDNLKLDLLLILMLSDFQSMMFHLSRNEKPQISKNLKCLRAPLVKFWSPLAGNKTVVAELSVVAAMLPKVLDAFTCRYVVYY